MNLFDEILFVLVFFTIYWLVGNNNRWFVLLFSNIVYSLYKGINCFLSLLSITIFSYLLGLLINKCKKNKKLVLYIGVAIIILFLSYFKYNNSLKMPLGLSFYSFEAISYIVDVYKGENPEKNFGIYSSYLSFFPTISSGPINNPFDTIEQIKKEKTFSYTTGIKCIQLILLGLFEKLVVADNIGGYIDPIYNNPNRYNGLTLLIIIVLFSIQIYADFSGYSLIARGIAGLFGIKVNINFDKPYFSTTIKEFWSKWHISLSEWLKKYVYIPLGGNRCGRFRGYINLLITFIISGMWHGSNYTFIIWGLIHGLLSIVERVFGIKKIEERYSLKWWLRCILLNIILCISWVFFRANNIADSLYILNPLNWLQGINNPISYIMNAIVNLKLNRYLIIEILAFIIILFLVDYISQEKDVFELIDKNKTYIKLIIYALIVLVIFALKSTAGVSFIYDQF